MTTRPTGYTERIAPEHLTQFDLRYLDGNSAVKYGHLVTSRRLADDLDRGDRLIAVLHTWQERLDSIRAFLLAALDFGEDPDPEVNLSEFGRCLETARQMLAVVDLIAPTKVRMLGSVAVEAGGG